LAENQILILIFAENIQNQDIKSRLGVFDAETET
jgi:hypothetical protein